jgi:hypothetical protein
MTTGRQSVPLNADLIRVLSRTERLALAQTIMANQRTFLSYVTSCIGLLATGYGLIKLADHPLLQAAGFLPLALSVAFGISGFARYRAMYRLLGRITAGQLLRIGLSLLHEEAGSAGDDGSAAGRENH